MQNGIITVTILSVTIITLISITKIVLKVVENDYIGMERFIFPIS